MKHRAVFCIFMSSTIFVKAINFQSQYVLFSPHLLSCLMLWMLDSRCFLYCPSYMFLYQGLCCLQAPEKRNFRYLTCGISITCQNKCVFSLMRLIMKFYLIILKCHLEHVLICISKMCCDSFPHRLWELFKIIFV